MEKVNDIIVKKDAIIGSITNYNVIQLKPYVNSLLRSGFNGDKYMICYDVSYDVVNYLKENGFIVHTFESNEEKKNYFYNKPPNYVIVVERFLHMYSFLSQLPENITSTYRYLISTDVGDVVFQSNPSEWLSNNINDFKIIAASESVIYKNEIYWGANNLLNSFGQEIYDKIKDNLIFNAGSLCGEFNILKNMFLEIYNMCQEYKTPNPDQAAYNVLLSLESYKSITKFSISKEGWAAQLGTTMVERFNELLFDKNEKPIFNKEIGLLCTSENIPYVIVHQYNRVPELIEFYTKKYE